MMIRHVESTGGCQVGILIVMNSAGETFVFLKVRNTISRFVDSILEQ